MLNARYIEAASIRLYEAETSVETVAARHGLDVAAIIDFSLNVNPFGPPPSAVAAARAALDAANLYPDLRVGRLRRAVAERHGVSEDALFFGAGLDDVIKLLIHAWTTEGDAVLVHLPTFPRYELEAMLRGCRIVAVTNEPAEDIDPAKLDAALRQQKVALAFLCTPNNPTGRVLPLADIAALSAAFAETLFLVDEALIDPASEGAVALAKTRRNVIVLRTFSKYFGLAGLRVGYAVGDLDLIRAAEVGRPPFNVAAPSVGAAAAALGDTAFLARCKAVFAEELAFFAAEVKASADMAIRGSHANMVLLELRRRGAAQAADALAARGIIVADASSFRGLEQRDMLRISLRDRAANRKLLAALKAVA